MAVVVCRVCDGKQFKTEEAYQQHAKTNTKHLKKTGTLVQLAQNPSKVSITRISASPANVGATTANVLPPPVLTTKPGYCKTCQADFGSIENLSAHYSSGEARHHPKCIKCSKGFENHAVLETVRLFLCNDSVENTSSYQSIFSIERRSTQSCSARSVQGICTARIGRRTRQNARSRQCGAALYVL
jgi:hypothetical protein